MIARLPANHIPSSSDGTTDRQLRHHAMKALGEVMSHAEDLQLQRVITMVDAIADRGQLDQLIAPLRPRLSRLRLLRPLRFTRLMFLPLNPLIVPAQQWRPEHPTIPRTALEPLAGAVRLADETASHEVDRLILGQTTGACTVIAQAGHILWSTAARVLPGSDVPTNWSDKTGFRPELYGELSAKVGAVLGQVSSLHILLQEVGSMVPPQARVRAILTEVRSVCPEALGMMVALILARLPQAAPDLVASGQSSGVDEAIVVATTRAKSTLMQQLESDSGTESAILGSAISDAAGEVRRMAQLLRTLETEGGSVQRRRVDQLSRRLSASCFQRFKAGLEKEFVRPLQTLAATPSDEDVARLEGAARGLSSLQDEAVRLGAQENYDVLIRQAMGTLQGLASNAGLTVSDRVRLVERLAGPEAAWTMLQEAEKSGRPAASG
jgi:hypothetical protein